MSLSISECLIIISFKSSFVKRFFYQVVNLIDFKAFQIFSVNRRLAYLNTQYKPRQPQFIKFELSDFS